ncbi:MAG: PAS domain S-box protein [Myxococcales bacterium]|nr:PAS domain S-box protein [Myxococcales bacterium]
MLELDASRSRTLLGPYLETLIDGKNEWSIERVTQEPLTARFAPSHDKVPNFGLTHAAVWARFTIHNRTERALTRYLICEMPVLQTLDAFFPLGDGRYQQKTVDFRRPFRDREIDKRQAVFSFHLAPGERQEIYLRFVSQDPLLLWASVWDPRTFEEYDRGFLLIVGVGLGILFGLLLFNLTLLIALRNIDYLYYLIFLLSFVLYQLCLSGLTHQYIWPNRPWLAQYGPVLFGGLTICFGMEFFRRFLNIRNYLPQWDGVFKLIIVLAPILTAMGLIDYSIAVWALMLLTILLFPFLLFVTLASWRRDNPLAPPFLLAWTFYLGGGVVFGLLVSGSLLPGAISMNGVWIGFFLGCVVLSLAKAERLLRRRHSYAKEAATLKKLQEEQKESERRFRLLADNSSDVIWMATLPELRLTYISPSSRRLFGFSPEEMIGHELGDFIGPASAANTREVLKSELAKPADQRSTSLQFAISIISKQGAVLEVEIATSWIPGERGEPVALQGSIRDVTERNHAANHLAKSEERYRLLAENLTDVIWSMDLNFRYTYISPSVQAMLGFSVREMLALPLDRQMTSLSYQRFIQALTEELEANAARYLEPHGHRAVEIELYRRDGLTLWAETRLTFLRGPDGRPRGVMGLTRDITERKEAEERDRKNARDLAILSETAMAFAGLSHEGEIYEVIGEQLQRIVTPAITLVNEFEEGSESVVCRTVHGIGWRMESVVEFLGMSPIGMNFPRPSEETRRDLLSGRLFSLPAEKYLAFFSQLNKAMIPVVSRTFDLERIYVVGLNWQGKLYGSMVVVPRLGTEINLNLVETFAHQASITLQRIRAERRSLALEAQLFQAQKMEAIGRLAGGVAHDFNNLLTGIAGNVSLAEMIIPREHQAAENLVEIGRAVERAAALTKQLLAFSRKQIIEPKVVDLNQVVENLRKMLGRLIGEDIELQLKLDPSIGLVLVDPTQIEQIIINLAVNARDAMPDGGRLTIATGEFAPTAKDREKRPQLVAAGYVMLSVADNGCGIEPELLGKIFEPFFTTKAKGKGTGLGLATVYGIVAQHNGDIEVESTPHQGSVFRILLPRLAAGPEVEATGGGDEVLPTGRETILLVEDEDMVRETTEKQLSRLGYRVLSAANGDDALRILLTVKNEVDLMLTDVIMPGMNGRELADRAQEYQPTLRVLFTSGYTDDHIVSQGVLEPNLHFLAKPYSVFGLAQKVRQVLDQGSLSIR